MELTVGDHLLTVGDHHCICFGNISYVQGSWYLLGQSFKSSDILPYPGYISKHFEATFDPINNLTPTQMQESMVGLGAKLSIAHARRNCQLQAFKPAPLHRRTDHRRVATKTNERQQRRICSAGCRSFFFARESLQSGIEISLSAHYFP